MDRLNKLDVYYHDQKIGTMALYQNRLVAFAYSDEWVTGGILDQPIFSSSQQQFLRHLTEFPIWIMIFL